MKKFMIMFFTMLAVISVIVWFVYTSFTFRIILDERILNATIVAVHTVGVERDIYTKDKYKISEVINHLNSIRYYKSDDLKIYSSSPDAYVVFYDNDGNVIDEIKYHGYAAIHNNNKYGILPFTYRGIEKLCDKLNDE